MPFPVEHPTLLQPWLPTLKHLFNTSQARINGKLGMLFLVGLQGWGGQGEGGEVSGLLQCLSVLSDSELPYWPGAQWGLEGQGDPLEYNQSGFF